MGPLRLLIVLLGVVAMADPLPQGLAGHWRGSARIAVSWTSQRLLPVEIEIDPQFVVKGRVGDAAFGPTKIKRQPWFMYGLLGNPEYIACGNLQGAVIARDRVTRKSACVIVNAVPGRLTGGIQTSGRHGAPWWGAEECRRKMWLAAFGLVLKRAQ